MINWYYNSFVKNDFLCIFFKDFVNVIAKLFFNYKIVAISKFGIIYNSQNTC